MKQILCWNFILPSLALCCCFLVGFCLVRKLPAICVGWLSAILASLLFSFYVCLILFLLALAFSRLQLNVKIRNNYFSIPLVSAENNSSKEICNLWIKSQPQKLRVLRGVIEFHVPERLLRTAPVSSWLLRLRVNSWWSPRLTSFYPWNVSVMSSARLSDDDFFIRHQLPALNKMSNKSMANIECGCPMNKIIISSPPEKLFLRLFVKN